MCFVFRLTLYFYFANAAAHMKSQLYSLLLASIVPTLSRYLTFMCQIPTQSFPGGSVVKKKKSVCQCRRHGFELWSGKIPHAAEQLSLSAISIEPVLQRAGLATTEAHALKSLYSTKREATTKRRLLTTTRKQSLLTTTREKPKLQQRPSRAKNK